MTDDIVARLREDAEDHKDVAGCCDCDPKDTRNWQHALNNEEAADEIERLRAALRQLAEIDKIENGFIRIKEVIHYTRFMARAALREATDDAAT